MEILNKLSLYLDGKLTRTDLVEWCKLQNVSGAVASDIKDPVAEAAFWVMYSATVKDNAFNEEGIPYFIRDYDLQEWFLSIKRQNFPYAEDNDVVQQLRPHQIFGIQTDQYAAFNITPSELRNRLGGIEHIRGLDDLDYFQEYNFKMHTGIQFRLLRYMRSPEPHAFILYSNEKNPAFEIHNLLNHLGLSISDAIWVNPEMKKTWERIHF